MTSPQTPLIMKMTQRKCFPFFYYVTMQTSKVNDFSQNTCIMISMKLTYPSIVNNFYHVIKMTYPSGVNDFSQKCVSDVIMMTYPSRVNDYSSSILLCNHNHVIMMSYPSRVNDYSPNSCIM